MASRSKKVYLPNLEIEGARIGMRNFAGKEMQYNPKGQRNFCVFLDEELAEKLALDGWNVKVLKPRDPEDKPQAFLKVKVMFGDYPPKIELIAKNTQTRLEEEDVKILDYAEIKNIDMIVNPSSWEMNGKTGITAYLKTMYVTLAKEDFGGRYSDVPKDDQEPPFDV